MCATTVDYMKKELSTAFWPISVTDITFYVPSFIPDCSMADRTCDTDTRTGESYQKLGFVQFPCCKKAFMFKAKLNCNQFESTADDVDTGSTGTASVRTVC